MEIKVLGMGCPRCARVEQLAREAASELGIEAHVEHITDMKTIMEYPISGTPALVVDGKVVASGRIPQKDEIVAWLKEAHA